MLNLVLIYLFLTYMLVSCCFRAKLSFKVGNITSKGKILAKKDITTSVESLKILKSSTEYEESVKKSKFVVHASYVKDEESAFAFIDRVKDLRATHNCWAYRLRSTFRVNDDGEPCGTAGRPILSAIDSLLLMNTVVVVTRYYGGIKLGTGGLIRAYQSAAKNALLAAELGDYVEFSSMSVTVSSGSAGIVYNVLEPYKGSEVGERYNMEDLTTTLTCDLPTASADKVKNMIMDITKGSAQIRLSE